MAGEVKSLGRIAFEAWSAAQDSPARWEDHVFAHVGWEAAAKAVLASVQQPKPSNAQMEFNRAVAHAINCKEGTQMKWSAIEKAHDALAALEQENKR